MLLGLELASSQGCRKIIIHYDNSFVTGTLNIVFTYSRDFASIKIEHCSRETNVVAHELGRQAKF